MNIAKAARPRHRADGVGALGRDGIADHVGAIATPLAQSLQVIRAELFGSDRCCALGITANSAAPAFALCRALLASGHDPKRPLHVYRGEMLALVIRTIRQGAKLTVEDDRHGTPRFRRWRNRAAGYGAGSPVRQLGVVDTAGTPARDGQRGGR
jgi:hypothetical protein